MYIADDTGKVSTFSSEYLSDDNGTGDASAISCQYLTKVLDFSDQAVEAAARFKTIYGIRLLYQDISTNAVVKCYISTDGGGTWTEISNTIGSSDNVPLSQNYFTIKTAENFQLKIYHSSTDKDIMLTGIEIDYLIRGDYRNL